jgi:hypothetical protein
MCHSKTCADRLHVFIVVIAIAVLYSLASCLNRFPFLHTCILFTSPRFYALPTVHDTSNKNAKLSSATTSFPWRHTNTSKNHGYKAVADESCRTRNCRLLQRHFHDVTNSSKNHGYNAVADDLRRQPFRAEDSALASDERGQKGTKGQTFSDHTSRTVSSRPRGRCVQCLVQIGSEM